jgi:gamma-glutamylputrescine oxidase
MSYVELREFARAPVARALPQAPSGPLRGTRRAEVCVIGAGYAGLSTALHLAERGYDTIVLEAASVGAGASGRNGGQVLPGFAAEPAAMIAGLGEVRARELWTLSRRGAAKVRALAGAACAVRQGVATVAARASHLAGIAEHVRLRREVFGETGIECLDAASFARAIPGLRGHGGALDARAFSLDPGAYVATLAARACQAGAEIREASPAIALARESGFWRVRAPSGEVRAERVVLATNVDLDRLDKGARRLAAPVRTFMLETAPIPGLPDWTAHAAYDTSLALRYMRRTADGRVRFGAGGWPGRSTPPMALRWLRHALARAIPALAGARVERCWSGLVDVTSDGMPRFARADGLYRLLGFCGHGIALATLAGLATAEAIDGETRDFDSLAALAQTPLWPTRIGQAAQLVLGRAAAA